MGFARDLKGIGCYLSSCGPVALGWTVSDELIIRALRCPHEQPADLPPIFAVEEKETGE